MFAPEYTITSEILKNISTIEYCRALIENTPILPHWQRQLQKEALVKTTQAVLIGEGFNFTEEVIKKEIDGFNPKGSSEVKNFITALSRVNELSHADELDDSEIKEMHKILSTGRYRSSEEILAEIVKLFDWYNSLDARDTHAILVAGIFHAQIERIKPFDNFNSAIAVLFARICLKLGGYSLNNFLAFEDEHSPALESVSDDNFTEWLEYYTDTIARKISNLKEKVLLLARDTKIAKATGRIDLTPRQGKIVEYLQDYGILQNKDFTRIFPGVSEDSVLRDLKVLIDKGIVAKRGSTKSSRYELK